MRRFLEMVGVGFDYAKPMKRWLEDAELDDIHERIIPVTYDAACTDEEVASRSVAHLVTAAAGLRDFTKGSYLINSKFDRQQILTII